MFGSFWSSVKEHSYASKMAVASGLVMLKVYVLGHALDVDQFALILHAYYVGGVLVFALPLGSMLYMHSILTAEASLQTVASARVEVDRFVTVALMVTIATGTVLSAFAKAIGLSASTLLAILFALTYSVSQISILRVKVYRDYDRFAGLLVFRASMTTAIVVVAAFMEVSVPNLIVLESITMLLVAAVLLVDLGFSLREFRGELKKIVSTFVPSISGALYTNADRLVATAVLTEQNLARYGLLYLLVSGVGTAVQFANTKILPELFVAESAKDVTPLRERLRAAYLDNFRRGTGALAVLFLVLLAVTLLLAATLPFKYSRLELLIVPIVCMGRFVDILGSVSMVLLGMSKTAIIQSVVMIVVVSVFLVFNLESVASALSFTLFMNLLMATIVLASLRQLSRIKSDE